MVKFFSKFFTPILSKEAINCIETNICCGILSYRKTCLFRLVKELSIAHFSGLDLTKIDDLKDLFDNVTVDSGISRLLEKASIDDKILIQSITDRGDTLSSPNVRISKHNTLESIAFMISSTKLGSLITNHRSLKIPIDYIWMEIVDSYYAEYNPILSYDKLTGSLSVYIPEDLGEDLFRKQVKGEAFKDIEWFYKISAGEYSKVLNVQRLKTNIFNITNNNLKQFN